MRYYLVGIKGTGMSSLAKMLKEEGNEVKGSDVKDNYFTVSSLNEYQIPILEFKEENITDDYFYIIGNAYTSNNIEVATIISKGYPYLYYHEFIGKRINKRLIACAGTHGKTTTSYLITNLLNKECSYIIGDGEGGSYPNDLLVLEACEYKEHFLSYHPEILIINNIELDHTDYYKNKKMVFKAFQKLANQSQIVLVNGDDKLANKIKHPHLIKFGFKKHNEAKFKILSTTSKGYFVQLAWKTNHYLKVPFLGKHMIYNYLASYITVLLLKKEPFLNNQQLPKKRLTTYYYEESIMIDDYAHHPTEIKALYETLKLMYPSLKIKVVFQPHTYERTLHFKKSFKKILKQFDEVYILDVFTSKRENTSIILQKKIDKYFNNFFKINKLDINKIGKTKEVWVFLGAGLAGEIMKNLLQLKK